MSNICIDHYSVDFMDSDGVVREANDEPLESLTAAKALASKVSRQQDTGAYVVAHSLIEGRDGKFAAVGHISFFDGKQDATDGIVI